jgi:hypothetical protein
MEGNTTQAVPAGSPPKAELPAAAALGKRTPSTASPNSVAGAIPRTKVVFRNTYGRGMCVRVRSVDTLSVMLLTYSVTWFGNICHVILLFVLWICLLSDIDRVRWR